MSDEIWNPEPEFWQLVREAHDAIEAVDHYDLRSDDPESVKAFRELARVQARDAHALIHFITKHEGELRALFSEQVISAERGEA